MQGQLLNKYQSPSGSQFPAAQQTSQYLLQPAIDGCTDKSIMVAAVESDPLVFAAVLCYQPKPLASLGRWHEHINAASLRALITLIVTQSASDERLLVSVGRQSLVTSDSSGLMRSLLAAKLVGRLEDSIAEDVGGVMAENARLMGLLAGVAVNPDKLASLSRDWNLMPPLADALRFFRLPEAELADVGLLIKVLALGEKLLADLAHYTPGSFANAVSVEVVSQEAVSVETVSASLVLLGLPTTTLKAVLRDALLAHDQIMAQCAASPSMAPVKRFNAISAGPSAPGNLQQLANEAGIGNALYRAFTRQPGLLAFNEQLIASAQFLFGFSGVLHFTPQSDRLIARVSEQEDLVLSMARNDSAIAVGYTRRRMSVVSAARVVVDLQVMDRLGAESLLIVPLGVAAGVLACGLPAGGDSAGVVSTTLMMAFASAASDAFAQQCLAAAEDDQIPLEYLQQRVREVTHEVNNPLTIVQNYLHVLSLKLDEDTPVQADIVTIGAELTRVANIVGKYSGIGKAAGLLAQAVDVNDILTQLVSVVRGGQVDINMALQLDPAMPQIVLSPDSLKQVIINLIKNATEALQGTTITDKTLRIETTAAVNVGGREYIEIAIIDNGPGIDPVIRKHLFLANNSTKKSAQGGLGLNIVKQLIDAMQGLISCRSKVSTEGSAGTCFQILIPVERVSNE